MQGFFQHVKTNHSNMPDQYEKKQNIKHIYLVYIERERKKEFDKANLFS
jgi:hypothetical protein